MRVAATHVGHGCCAQRCDGGLFATGDEVARRHHRARGDPQSLFRANATARGVGGHAKGDGGAHRL